MTNPQKQLIIKAVGELGRRVTVADVVAKTGQSIESVAQSLNALAAETNATLEVTKNGEIFYCYPANFYYAHLAHGFAILFTQSWSRFGSITYFAFKISFGIVLLVSIICVMSAILMIQSVLMAFAGQSTAIVNMWIDFWGICRRFAARQLIGGISQQQLEGGKANFLLDCYSFLFGDGNPNGNVEEARWQLIAQTIRLNEGVVIAEHLAPYLTRDPDEERDIFAVLAKFGGIPEVSESGNIVYIFPTMRARSEVSSYALVPALLEQKPWQFSFLTRAKMKPVVALAVANLIGSAILVLFFALTHRRLHQVFSFFCIYSLLFLLIPAVRFVILKFLNRDIRASNKRAHEYEERLGNPSAELLAKLDDAEQTRHTTPQTVAGEVIYTTAKDLLDQDIEQQSQ